MREVYVDTGQPVRMILIRESVGMTTVKGRFIVNLKNVPKGKRK